MLTETQSARIEEYFEIRPMNDWMRAARSKPVPKHLFGDLWREGEIAIMFADTGKGKSVLAVQIAEAIARGRHIYPFETTVKPRKVLYLDFELTDKQIEMRYTADHDPAKGDVLKRPYTFSQRLRRIELKPDVLHRRDGQHIEEALREMIQPLLIAEGAKILIIDNITYLKRTADGTREAIPLMRELQRLQRRFGLSILVIAHTPKRDARRPLAVNDLQGAKVIANFADNIFAIGQSRRKSTERYIKHIKPRSDEVMYDATHLPTFTLKKINGNFLGFEHTGFAAETELLREPEFTADPELVGEIKELHDAGMSIRAIAEKLGLSKSTAHRYLQMWQPKGAEDDLEDEDDLPPPDPTLNPYYYPGREENDARRKELSEMGIFDDDIDSQFRSREYYILECASARARKIYLKTGTAPPLAEDEQYTAFMEAVRLYKESGGDVVQEPIAYIVRRFVPEPCVSHESLLSSASSMSSENTDNSQNTANSVNSVNPLDGMKLVIDDYGKERFIESEYEDGKPRVWYQYRSDGALRRWEHNGDCVTASAADPAVFGRWVRRVT